MMNFPLINPLKQPVNILLVGVGGQGTILASNILAELGLRLGLDVKQAEIHGMSQRGGSVVSHLRWGEKVFSPIIPPGEADILLAFEKLEAARFSDHLRPGGIALINDHSINPMTVSAGLVEYPDHAQIQGILNHVTGHIYWINGLKIAEELGNTRTANVVLLGALSSLMTIDPTDWATVIQARLSAKVIEINLKAFQTGRQALRN
ncbi:MAG: indolepyruvate oxidoreductase subunit beta [Anaerolineales bacterium]